MTTLQELRDKVRLQTDLDQADLPDSTLDSFLQEGFDRTMASERRWPFFEYTWTLTQADVDDTITLPTAPEIAHFVRMRSEDGYTLVQLSQADAEDMFQGTPASAEPRFYSLWGGLLYLWPLPTDVARTYQVRGFRKPQWTGVGTDTLDGDERLHKYIAHYATALAYAQLEDPEQEATYMGRWSRGVKDIADDLMRPMYHEPIILNGGTTLDRPTNRVTLVP